MILDGIVEFPPPKYPPLTDIKKARKAKKLTLEYMADFIGVDWFTYMRFESGRLLPNDETLRKIRDALDMRSDTVINQFDAE